MGFDNGKMSCRGAMLSLDIVFCIDMSANISIANDVKNTLCRIRNEYLEEKIAEGNVLRVRFVLFRDYRYPNQCPMEESRFFTLDDELDEAVAFLDGKYGEGGGDAPENALEALALAMRSDWWTEAAVRRHVILLFTDAAPHPLGALSDCEGYPQGMPSSFDELHTLWEEKMPKKGSRLLVFAPDVEPWSNMYDWTNTFFSAVEEQGNCVEFSGEDGIEACYRIIENSI